MEKQEFDRLMNAEKEKRKVVSCDDLINKEDRTLLYGYTCNRETWHVYIKNNQIYSVAYSSKGIPSRQIEVTHNLDYIPDKRLYPERCDFEFCSLLKQKEIVLPFTSWTENIETKKYYGKVF